MIAAAAPDDWLSRPTAFVVTLAVVSLLPFAFMTLTAFVKISTVLQIVRSAIGAQGIPSTTVLMALAGVLTVIAMGPVGERMMARASPLFTGKMPDTETLVREGIDAVGGPMHHFFLANTSDVERARFFDVVRRSRPESERAAVHEDDWAVIAPAFLVSELGEAFALGFLIYLPFLVIDMVVANVLLALGMQMMSPTQVSLPFKLLLFVAIDGWGLLSRSLVSGYHF